MWKIRWLVRETFAYVVNLWSEVSSPELAFVFVSHVVVKLERVKSVTVIRRTTIAKFVIYLTTLNARKLYVYQI